MDKQLAQSIGRAAREARNELKLTQEDAAERTGVSAEFYARIERGNALPSVPTLARISSALGVSADLMLGQTKVSRGKNVPKPQPANDPPEVRRVLRRVRQASPPTLRLVGLLIREIERLK